MSAPSTHSTHAATPGVPVYDNGELISSNPVTGIEVGRFPIADAEAVAAAVARAREASTWWAGLGHRERKTRLLRWCAAMARRIEELADLMHAEGGKPTADGVVEVTAALEHLAYAARSARRVLGPRRTKGSLMLPEFSAQLEYLPFGVIGVIGPWNYPIVTPFGSIAYALAAGNAVVFKPSEYSPAVAQWFAARFAEVVPEKPVLQVVYGGPETGATLVSADVDKVAFTGSTRTGKRIMAACAERLTPVLLECGGKDAMIVDTDADIDAAADAAVWGAMTNAGQTCAGVERVYVAADVYDRFLQKMVAKASKLRVGAEPGADIGPITMPSQIDVIRRHIDDALARGGKAVLGGAGAVRPPFVYPTILVNVPEDAAAVTEETFGPTVTVTKVDSAERGVELANAVSYGLGSAVYGRARAMLLARALRTGMTSINGTLSFAGMASLPFGGVGDSGFGRIHGEDGLREFTRAKAITKRRMRSFVPITTFEREPKHIKLLTRLVKLLHGRSR